MKEPTFVDLQVHKAPNGNRLLTARFRHGPAFRRRAWHHTPGRSLLDAGVGPWFAPTVDLSSDRYRHFRPESVRDEHVAAVLGEYFGELTEPSSVHDLTTALKTAKRVTIHPAASARTLMIITELRRVATSSRSAIEGDYSISPADRARLRKIIVKLTDHANAHRRASTLGGTP